MSSSKILKHDDLKDQMVCSFSFGTIVEGASRAEASGNDLFVPLQIRDCTVGGPVSHPSAASPPETVHQSENELILAQDDYQARLDEEYNRGLEEGRRQAERGLGNVFKALRDGVVKVTGLKEKMLRDSEDDLLKLTIMIARKVILQEMVQDQRILANVIGEALSSISDLDKVTLRLNPSDYTVVNANRQMYLAGMGDDTPLVILPDETIAPGGCMVDTSTGTVDARVDVQLEEIYRQLLEQRSIPQESDEFLGSIGTPDETAG